MTIGGIKSSLGLAVLVALFFTPPPILADEVNPEYRELIRRGNSQVRTGKTMMWTGAALLPLSALALVPVVYDGAFGITAADPGIGGFIGAAGLGLIHAGIPIYGFGASKLEQGAGEGTLGGPEFAESGWSHYRRSWKFMAGGSVVLVAALPLAIAGALDWERNDSPLDYTAGAMGITGIGLLAIGTLEQHYSLYRFAKATGSARDRLQARPQVSLQPLFRMDRQGPGAGMRVTCSF